MPENSETPMEALESENAALRLENESLKEENKKLKRDLAAAKEQEYEMAKWGRETRKIE